MKSNKKIIVNIKIKDYKNSMEIVKIIKCAINTDDLNNLNEITFLRLYLIDNNNKIKGCIFKNVNQIVDISSKAFFFKQRKDL